MVYVFHIVLTNLSKIKRERSLNNRSAPTCAILFVKEPYPGQVKTRLHGCCSPQQAAALYRAFVLDSATILAASAATLKVVAYAPVTAAAAMRQLLSPEKFEFIPQPETDLGRRMDRLLHWSMARGARRTVIIGSDSPSLPPTYIDQALDLLKEHEVVLGPSTDGGYYLVGQSSANSTIFVDIDWSTGRVLEQTLEKVGTQSLGLLPPWYDVDTPPEAGFLKVHLEALQRAGSPQGRHSLPLLRKLDLPPPS